MHRAGGDDPSPLPARRCERYRRDGRRCENLTTHPDGWCHDPACDGFRRAATRSAPEEVDGPPGGTERQIAAAPATGLRAAPTLHVTTAALDSYRFHHGGSIDSAARELRDMLAAFLDHSAMRRSRDYVVLSREGYQLIVDAEVQAITGYRTVHRERTWAQLCAGVPSRFGGGRPGGRHGGLLREPAQRVPPDFDPATVTITPAALKGFAPRRGVPSPPPDPHEAAPRGAPAPLLAEGGAGRNHGRGGAP